MGGACGTCGGEVKCMQGFGGETRGDHMEYVGISETMIRKSTLKKQNGKVWIGFIWIRNSGALL